MAAMEVAIPMDSFYEDSKELINRCSKNRKVNYRDFTRVWHDMHFGRIFEDISSGARITDEEDYRELINVAKRLMVISTATYEESVAAMFLVHGLLNLPPFAERVTLILNQTDDHCLDRIELVATHESRTDVLYILGAVLVKSIEVPIRSNSLVFQYRKGLEHRRRLLVNYIRNMGTKTKMDYSKMTQSILGSGYKDPFLGFYDESCAANLSAAFQKMLISPDDDKNGPSTSFYEKAVGAKRALEPTASTSKYETELTYRKKHEQDQARPSTSGKAGSSPAIARVIPTMAEIFRPQEEYEKEDSKRVILKSRRSRMAIVSHPHD